MCLVVTGEERTKGRRKGMREEGVEGKRRKLQTMKYF
jgi:hypothetical protein